MTLWNGCRIGLAAVLGLAMSAGSGLAGEEKISREDLPKAIRKAVAEKFPKAKIRGVSNEVEHGKTTFEVEMTIKDRSVDAVFNAKGKLLEIEKEIPVSKLPKKVREEIAEHFPGAKIEKAEAVLRGGGDHGPVVYEVDLEAVLTRDGKIVRGHEEEADEEEEHEHHAAEGKKEHKGHGEASCECCAKGEECKECKKKEHDDRDDDDDDDAEKHEHHAKGEHKGHGETHAKDHKGHGEAHAKGKKEHEDRDDDDDDDDAEMHEHHAKGEHKGHGEAHAKDHKGHGDAKSKGEKHDDDDDDDDDR